MNTQAYLLAATLLAANVGCVALQENTIDATNHLRSWLAWHGGKHHGCHPRHALIGPGRHYACGWRAGFYDACCGRWAHPPLLPPENYWGVPYQNEVGQADIRAWFDGHRDGVVAAQSSGAIYSNIIPAQVMQPMRDMPAQYMVPADGEPIPPGIEGESIAPPEPLPDSDLLGLPTSRAPGESKAKVISARRTSGS